MTKIKSQSELYELFKKEVLAQGSELKDFEIGSMNDIIGGAISIPVNELSTVIVDEFTKTFFSMAEGGDLDKLALDHYGEKFRRPEAKRATTSVKLFRPNLDKGSGIIDVGTVVKTEKDYTGEEVSFTTLEPIEMTGLEIYIEVQANTAGTIGNVEENKITTIETALFDASIMVTNESKAGGGVEKQTDEEYRETIYNLIESLAGATEPAVVGACKAVPEIKYVEPVTEEKIVKEFSLETMEPVGDYFRIPYPVLYIADVNGMSSDSMISEAELAIFKTKGAGVKILVRGATAIGVNVTAIIDLKLDGPNFDEFQSDTTKIKDSIRDYLTALPIGSNFSRQEIRDYILNIWGSDLSNFYITNPVGNVTVSSSQKVISGSIEI